MIRNTINPYTKAKIFLKRKIKTSEILYSKIQNMEQHNLFYFTNFEKSKISKGWSLDFIKAINLIKTEEIPKTFESTKE